MMIMARRKDLKGIVSGLVGSFISRNNDVDGYWAIGMLCLLAQNLGISCISISLAGGAEEEEAHPIIRLIAEHYLSMLQSMLAKTKVNPGWVQRAMIVTEFGTSGNQPVPTMSTWGNPFVCTVSITDDHRRTWSASRAGRCVPHDPKRERRSARAKNF
jgi:hypothetical protein